MRGLVVAFGLFIVHELLFHAGMYYHKEDLCESLICTGSRTWVVRCLMLQM